MSRRARAAKGRLVHREYLDEAAFVDQFIRRVVAECPDRRPTSDAERRAHDLVRAELEKLGLEHETQSFQFNENLYANLVLHFGLGVAGTLVAGRRPGLGMLLHLLAGFSYVQETTRRGYVLRRLFPWKTSRNVLGRLRGAGETRLRIVFVTHVDAAFTGLLFQPSFVEAFGSSSGPLSKSLGIATRSLFALAAVDAASLIAPNRLGALGGLRWALTIPALAATLLNLEIVARDEIVPGANDNLSGVAAMLLVAHRLLDRVPDGVEFVFAAVGCEEASLGGSDALARRMRGAWDPAKTVVVGLDGFSNGELQYFTEGEVFPVPLDERLRASLERVADENPAFAGVRAFEIPVGGTDAVPFALRGYPAVTVGTVAPGKLTPSHYHCASDTPDNLDPALVARNVDYVMALIDVLMEDRLGTSPA